MFNKREEMIKCRQEQADQQMTLEEQIEQELDLLIAI